MGFLKRAIRKGVSDAVSKAVGNAVQQAIEPKATKLANKAADSIDRMTENKQESTNAASNLEGALGNLQRSMEGYATEAAKNMKICPKCEEAARADQKFCPKCGAKLPALTVSEAYVCTSCGKQNTVGTKFCSECGVKLPAAIMEEQAEIERGNEVLAKWDELLAVYPKWSCGGIPIDIQEIESDYYIFDVHFNGDSSAASRAVEQYRLLAKQNGFHPAGEYPSDASLYNKINGVCYLIDTENCFCGDPDRPSIGFAVKDPYGGYYYVKP